MPKKKGDKKKTKGGGPQRTKSERRAEVRERLLASRERGEPASPVSDAPRGPGSCEDAAGPAADPVPGPASAPGAVQADSVAQDAPPQAEVAGAVPPPTVTVEDDPPPAPAPREAPVPPRLPPERRAVLEALVHEWKLGLLPFEASPPPTNGGAEAGEGAREETGGRQQATGNGQAEPSSPGLSSLVVRPPSPGLGDRQQETAQNVETKSEGDPGAPLRVPGSASRVRRVHPFAFLAAGALVLVGIFVYVRLTAVDRGRPEVVARAYIEAIFPDRRDLAVRRGSLFLAYFTAPKAPAMAPGTGAGETTFEVYLGRLAQLALVETALLSVRADGGRADVELLLVYSGDDRETYPVELCDTESGWRVLVSPGRPRLFAWEARVERELARLRQAVPALERGYEP